MESKNKDTNFLEKSLAEQFIKIFNELGIEKNDNIFITGNFSLFAKIKLKKNRKLDIFYNTLRSQIGKNGSIFCPTASMNICNTSTPFDLHKTCSHEMGALSEYIRKKDYSVRSFHPFWSVTGVGKSSKLLRNVGRGAYGAGSPWEIMLDLDFKQITFGVHPSRAVTLIHHIETVFGVPYRFIKEFNHPVYRKGNLVSELFYQTVSYKNSNVVKKTSLNKHYFVELMKRNQFHEITDDLGMNYYAFKFANFFDVAIDFFKKDIYNYLEFPPKVKPYQEL